MSAQVCEVNVEDGSGSGSSGSAHDAVSRLVLHLGSAGPAGLDEGLALLVDGLGLSGAAVRDRRGGLRASAGDLHLVDTAQRPVVELPLGGSVPATLTAVGAAPTQLAALQVAAAALGLALSSAPAPAPAPAGELVLLSEQDRDDLADSLHDGPVQQLVFARYAADAAVRGADAREARDAVQGALVALRRTMWHLRPRGSDLATALEELSLRLAEGGQRLLAVNVLPGGEDLGPAETALAYRLVQTVALAGRPTDDPLAVTVRPVDGEVVVSLPAQPVPALRADRWDRRARALGGRLEAGLSGLVLHLPSTPDPKAAS